MASQSQSNGLSPQALEFLRKGTAKVERTEDNPGPLLKRDTSMTRAPERPNWATPSKVESSSIGIATDSSSFRLGVDLDSSWPPELRRTKSLCGTPNRGHSMKRKSSEILDTRRISGDKKICSNTQTSCLTQNDVGYDEELMKMTLTLSQMLWTSDYLKYNPVKTNDVLLKTLNTLSEGLQEILLSLPRMHLSDLQYRQLLRVTEAFFQLVQTENCCNLPFIVVQLHGKTGDVFESFLDNLIRSNINAEGQLQEYALCSALIVYISEGEVRKIFMERLLIRLHRIVGKMLKASRSNQEDPLEQRMVEPDKINLLFFYCQLLETTITSANVEQGGWMDKRFYQNLLWIIENAESLFIMFPNLSYIFFGLLNAVKQCTKVERPVATPGFPCFGS